MKKLCYVATIPHVIFSFLSGHINAAAKEYDVSIISSSHDAHLLKNLPGHFIQLPIQRKISPWDDLITLAHLVKLFRRERFALVHSIMPKTGLLSMLAGWLTGVPCRIHTFTGQVWATQAGLKRYVLKSADKLIVAFATHIIVDSDSQRQFLRNEGVLADNQGLVIGNGSICGVDPARFCPDSQVKADIRAKLGIGLDHTLILFLGRLNKDKGMLELAQAFSTIASCRENVFLALVGAEEDVSYERIQEICGEHADKLRRILFTPDPHHYMAAADIFCLPSYREGFGQVIIEAAACAVPTVATRIYGITDAVNDNQTGLLIPVGDIDLLVQSLLKLIDNPSLRMQLGESARKRALELFSCTVITQGLIDLYRRLTTK